MSLLIGTFTIGLILALLSLGVFISFRIFNFPDITTEGSITLGASISAAMIVGGFDPWVATLVALAGGFMAGALTGIIHTRFAVNGLLSGILVMTALYSVNLHVMGKSNVPLMSDKTIITTIENLGMSVFRVSGDITLFGSTVPVKDVFTLASVLFIVLVLGLLLYLFLKSNLGTAMRATGNNQQMIRALGVNTNVMIILGLGISNALIALSGAVLAQFQGFADVQMGIGMLVLGLASVIIGEALISDKSLGYMIAGAIGGSLIFRLLVAVALRLGMNPNDLKLITAVFVFIALVLPMVLKKYKRRGAQSKC
ncbi:MAG: ABC transporter permease [Bacteroidetes bacterium]|nr:ABC transporter permease [Bacteroidota bacterium]